MLSDEAVLKTLRRIRSIVYLENVLMPVACVLIAIVFLQIGLDSTDDPSSGRRRYTYGSIKLLEIVAIAAVGCLYGVVQCCKSRAIIAQIAMDNGCQDQAIAAGRFWTGLRTHGLLKYGLFEIGAWLLVILCCSAFLLTKYTSIADRWFSPDERGIGLSSPASQITGVSIVAC